MFGKILCYFGLHKPVICNKFYPSISAEIVEEYNFSAKCSRCPIDLGSDHRVRNGQTHEFEEADPEKHDLKL